MIRKNDQMLFASLIQLFEEDLERKTEEGILIEAAQEFGSVEEMEAHFDSLLKSAEKQVKSQRLVNAKVGYQEAVQNERHKKTSDVLMWPLAQKLALLKTIHERNSALTLAARNDENSEDDINAILEDLIELKAIDGEGNIQ